MKAESAEAEAVSQPPARTYSFEGHPDRLSWRGAAGFLLIAFIAWLPTHGVTVWIDLTTYDRWASTEPLFAVAAVVVATVMLRTGVTPLGPLYLVVIAAVVVVVSSGYGFWAALHHAPGEDDYLSSGICLLGFFAIGASAVVGIVGSLVDRRRRP